MQSSIVLPEAMIVEILLRLPLKYLFRCKSVSKTWCSLISSSDIMKLHHPRNLGILISYYGSSKKISLLQTRLRLGIGGNPPPSPNFTKQFGGEYEIKFTQVINGIFCFYTSAGDLTLCNLYNYETMKLPLPSFYNRRRYYETQFYLGFDPFNRFYRLLGLFMVCGLLLHFEILNLNRQGSNWMKTGMEPLEYDAVLIREHTPSIVINQFMFWLFELFKDNNRREILVYNLAGPISARFSTIPLPPHFDQLSTSARIVKFRGRLAVGCFTTELNIWELDMRLWEFGRLRYWIKHSITLPEELVRCNRESWCSVGNFPTDAILTFEGLFLYTRGEEVTFDYNYVRVFGAAAISHRL